MSIIIMMPSVIMIVLSLIAIRYVSYPAARALYLRHRDLARFHRAHPTVESYLEHWRSVHEQGYCLCGIVVKQLKEY